MYRIYIRVRMKLRICCGLLLQKPKHLLEKASDQFYWKKAPGWFIFSHL